MTKNEAKLWAIADAIICLMNLWAFLHSFGLFQLFGTVIMYLLMEANLWIYKDTND